MIGLAPDMRLFSGTAVSTGVGGRIEVLPLAGQYPNEEVAKEALRRLAVSQLKAGHTVIGYHMNDITAALEVQGQSELTRLAEKAALTIEEHNGRAGYVLDWPSHGLEMLLVDVLAYARVNSFDLPALLKAAEVTLSDVTS